VKSNKSSFQATAFWLIIATLRNLPVSTTHSAVGATIGFSIVMKQSQGISGSMIVRIGMDSLLLAMDLLLHCHFTVISWVTSPIIAGFFAVVAYTCIKYTVFLAVSK